MTDLVDTWLKLPGVEPTDVERYGVGFRAAQMCGGIRQGKQGWLIGCWIDPPSIYRMVIDPVLIDIIRFDPARPSCWRSLYGMGAVLGEAALDEARIHGLVLPVFKNPLHWLQAAGGGVFPIDQRLFALAVTGYPPLRLAGEDIEHGREIQRMIDRLPKLGLPQIGIRRAA